LEQTQYNLLLNTVRDLASQTALLIRNNNSYWSNEEDMDLYTKNNSSQNNLFFSNSNSYSGKSPEYVLKNIFGFDSFRPLQKEIIQNVLDGRDTLAVMPTGGGKSLCYEIPALIMKGLTVVVSPLIALMQDQVTQLETYGVEAVFLNSSLDWDTYRDTADRIRNGEIKLLYVSPEGLNTGKIQDILHSENVDVDCITIDEAHCVSEWGHDFRPDYLEIASVREQFPKAVCLALTATATKQVRADIIKQLKLETPEVLVASFNRPNIYLEVKRKSNGLEQVISFLDKHKNESGIIYCFSRKQVDSLTDALRAQDYSVTNYHAGLTDDERTKHQNDFIRDKVNIIVATVAFGMGINKPDVRFVIHYDLPKSLEQYYQEIGRAGRDGLQSHALLLFSPADIHKIRYFFDESADSSKAEKLLSSMVSYAESRTCRRKFLLNYFGEQYSAGGKAKANLNSNGNALEVASSNVSSSSAALESTSSETCASTDNCCDVCSFGGDETDVTVPAQKYMSCILRTDERYGASYVIDVLLGSKQKRIVDNGHNNLSTWGIGKEYDKNDWFELNTGLLNAGYILKSEDYGVLTLSSIGHDALKAREKILLPVQISEHCASVGKGASKKSSKRAASDFKKVDTIISDSIDEEASRIAESLRRWRRHFADDMNVPPYVIFGDKTLSDIALKKPKTVNELLNCYGIGETKAEKFGSEILRIVRGDYSN